MKILIATIALALAVPAAAQTAPAAQQPDHSQHQQTPPPGQPPAQPQGGHQGHGEQGGCCADRNNNGRMDCCENMAAGRSCCAERTPQPAPAAQPQTHSGH